MSISSRGAVCETPRSPPTHHGATVMRGAGGGGGRKGLAALRGRHVMPDAGATSHLDAQTGNVPGISREPRGGKNPRERRKNDNEPSRAREPWAFKAQDVEHDLAKGRLMVTASGERFEGPRTFGLGLGWGRVQVHATNGRLPRSDLGMYLNETPTGPETGFGKIGTSHPLGSWPQVKSISWTRLLGAVVKKRGPC